MRTLISTLLLAVSFTALSALSACGVKAPPLPPDSSLPQDSDKTGWSPQRGTYPSPSPSPSPVGPQHH